MNSILIRCSFRYHFATESIILSSSLKSVLVARTVTKFWIISHNYFLYIYAHNTYSHTCILLFHSYNITILLQFSPPLSSVLVQTPALIYPIFTFLHFNYSWKPRLTCSLRFLTAPYTSYDSFYSCYSHLSFIPWLISMDRPFVDVLY